MSRKRPSVLRRPAHAGEYEGGRVDLRVAWQELRPSEFALWIRLCAEHPETLARTTKTSLAELLGYSNRRLNELLVELEHVGYVHRYTITERGRSGRVILAKMAMVYRGSGFLPMASVGA